MASKTNYHGTGGMFTKIEAAEIASESGCDTIFLEEQQKSNQRILKKETGTIFKGKDNNDKGFKKWLAGTIKVKGDIFLTMEPLMQFQKVQVFYQVVFKKYLENFLKVI